MYDIRFRVHKVKKFLGLEGNKFGKIFRYCDNLKITPNEKLSTFL